MVANLRELMSDMSEDRNCASWDSGLEYSIWLEMVGDCIPARRLWQDADLAKVKELHEATGVWCGFDEDFTAEEWRRHIETSKEYAYIRAWTIGSRK